MTPSGQRGGGWSIDRPIVLSRVDPPGPANTSTHSITKSCRVPHDLACFAGHFPDFPIVPGVLQLDWALEIAEELIGAPVHLLEIEQLKQLTPLAPRASFDIAVEQVDATADAESSAIRVRFTITGDGVTHARGRVRVLAPAPSESAA